jgi:hypothetical protein
VPEVVIVIARSAADLRCFALNNGNNRVIRDTATLDAMVVDDIT